MEKYQQFEEEFGRFVGNPNIVACSSGTSALHLALESMQMPKGTEVILCDFNMIAVARAVALAGLTPVFVDCDDKLLLDVSLLEKAMTPRTRVIIATHIYGRRCDMDAIAQFAATNGCLVIEDLAEAHGIAPHKATEAACWSFYKNKVIAGEEGGAVAYHPHLPKRTKLARELRSLGFTEKHDFAHIPRGHNYRMSNAHASLILDSMKLYESNLRYRRQAELWYHELTPQAWRMPPREVPWVYDMRIPDLTEAMQNNLISGLRLRGVAARHGFKPMTLQEEFMEYRHVGHHDALEHSEALAASHQVIYLPLSPGIPYQEVSSNMEYIKKTI